MNSHGKSIRLFLVDGTPTGVITAEIDNWTGHMISAPRTKLASLLMREECKKTGIYFLVGDNPDDPFSPYVYIGESDLIARRLKSHNDQKDFWENACFITSKDQNLTKSHARYLEKRLIDIAKKEGRCTLENGTEGYNNMTLPEADIAYMENFLEQITILLPVLGYDFLAKKRRDSMPQESQNSAPIFIIEKDDKAISASAIEEDGEFIVLKGSKVAPETYERSANNGYIKNLRPSLFEKGIIDPENFTFTEDYRFKSPSAAASVVMGRAANGRTNWKEQATGRTYAQVKENEIDQALHDES